MSGDLIKTIEQNGNAGGFIKVTDMPVGNLSDQQKVALNRKANELLNLGKLDMAERIFITTGYSDGLTRCGDKHQEKNEFMEALKLYVLAHNKRKSEPLTEKLAQIISTLINNKD